MMTVQSGRFATVGGGSPFGSHRYWRIFSSTNSGDGTFTGAAEAEFRGSVGGSDLVPLVSGPSALVLKSGESIGAEAFQAFDNNTNDPWIQADTTDTFIGYDFGSAVSIAEAALISSASATFQRMPQTGFLQHSEDDVTWSDAVAFGLFGWLSDTTRVIPEPAPAAGFHRFWRVFCQDNNGGTSFITLDEVEFRATVGGADLTPAMTNNSGDATGRVIRSSEAGGNEAFRAFDHTTGVWAGVGTTNQWVGFIFPDPVEVLQVALKGPPSGLTRAPNNVHIDFSDDEITWTAGSTTALGTWTAGQVKTINL
jgi:hypothetical protein